MEILLRDVPRLATLTGVIFSAFVAVVMCGCAAKGSGGGGAFRFVAALPLRREVVRCGGRAHSATAAHRGNCTPPPTHMSA